MDNRDDSDVLCVTNVVVDDELEVGDVDQGQTLRMLLNSLFISNSKKYIK